MNVEGAISGNRTPSASLLLFAGTFLRSHIWQARLPSSRLSPYPLLSRTCQTASGTGESAGRSTRSTLPVAAKAAHASAKTAHIALFIVLSTERAHERTPLSVQVPGDAQPGPTVGVRHRHRRHGMR